jgi:hypothetical protein
MLSGLVFDKWIVAKKCNLTYSTNTRYLIRFDRGVDNDKIEIYEDY